LKDDKVKNGGKKGSKGKRKDSEVTQIVVNNYLNINMDMSQKSNAYQYNNYSDENTAKKKKKSKKTGNRSSKYE
jgi:hypothetical protein